MHGAPSINLRARLTGDRQLALKTVLMLLQSASTVDLRDNRLVDDEALQLAGAIEVHASVGASNPTLEAAARAAADPFRSPRDIFTSQVAPKLQKLSLAGNRVSAGSGQVLCQAVKKCESRVTELDLSRNGICNGKDNEVRGLAVCSVQCAVYRMSYVTSTTSCGMDDGAPAPARTKRLRLPAIQTFKIFGGRIRSLPLTLRLTPLYGRPLRRSRRPSA